MRRDVPDRLWICPWRSEGHYPVTAFIAYRDSESACPTAARAECSIGRMVTCDGPVSIPPGDPPNYYCAEGLADETERSNRLDRERQARWPLKDDKNYG